MQQRTGDRQTTQLTAGELTTAFTQPAIQTFVLKQLMQPDLFERGTKCIVRCVRRCQQQVVAQRGAKQMHALWDNADGFA